MNLRFRWALARIAGAWFMAGFALRLLLWIVNPGTSGLSPDCRFMPGRLWCEAPQVVFVAIACLDLPLITPYLPLVAFVERHYCVFGPYTSDGYILDGQVTSWFSLGDLVILGANSLFWAGIVTVGLWLVSRSHRTGPWFDRGPLRRLMAPANTRAVAKRATRPFLVIAICWFLISGALFAAYEQLAAVRPYDDSLVRTLDRAADRAVWPVGSTIGLEQVMDPHFSLEFPLRRPCGALGAATVLATNALLWAAMITGTLVAVRGSRFLSRHLPPRPPPPSDSATSP